MIVNFPAKDKKLTVVLIKRLWKDEQISWAAFSVMNRKLNNHVTMWRFAHSLLGPLICETSAVGWYF